MELLLCIKHIKEAHLLDGSQVSSHMNPDDRTAMEAALLLKEQNASLRLTTLSIGPLAAETTMRESLTMGADESVLVTDSKFQGADTLMTSYILAQAIRHIGSFSCILCGNRSSDGATGQVGPELAGQLGIPIVTNVTKILELKEEELCCQRCADGWIETLQVSLPAVLTIASNAYTCRLKSLKDIFFSMKKSVRLLTNQELQLPLEADGYEESATKVKAIKQVQYKKKIQKEQVKMQRIQDIMKLILREVDMKK